MVVDHSGGVAASLKMDWCSSRICNKDIAQTDKVYHPKYHQAAAEGAGGDPLSGYRPAETGKSMIALTPKKQGACTPKRKMIY